MYYRRLLARWHISLLITKQTNFAILDFWIHLIRSRKFFMSDCNFLRDIPVYTEGKILWSYNAKPTREGKVALTRKDDDEKSREELTRPHFFFSTLLLIALLSSYSVNSFSFSLEGLIENWVNYDFIHSVKVQPNESFIIAGDGINFRRLPVTLGWRNMLVINNFNYNSLRILNYYVSANDIRSILIKISRHSRRWRHFILSQHARQKKKNVRYFFFSMSGRQTRKLKRKITHMRKLGKNTRLLARSIDEQLGTT